MLYNRRTPKVPSKRLIMRAHSIPEPDVTTIITIKRDPYLARPTGLPGRGKLFPAAIATVSIALVLVLQWVGGAYLSEFAGYPDEGAHYITGLMMRDYAAAHKLVDGAAANVERTSIPAPEGEVRARTGKDK